MSRFVDSVIAYRILKMLTTPFEDTDAFRLGIIDRNGKELMRMQDLNTVEEKDAYSILHRMIFRLKRIVEKVPLENKKLASFAAALALIKEHTNTTIEPINLESQYLDKLNTDLTEDIKFIEKYYSNKYILPFKTFVEEAPANNAQATPGISGLGPDTVVVHKRKKVIKRDDVSYVTDNTKSI